MLGRKFDVVLAEQILILAKAIKKLSLGKSRAALARIWLHALCPSTNTVGTRKRAAALDSALLAQSASEAPEAKLTNKEKYLSWFTLREENGDYIQDVKEMTRVPIILKTDLTKSPP